MDRYRERYALPLVDRPHGGAPAHELLREALTATVDGVVRDGSRPGQCSSARNCHYPRRLHSLEGQSGRTAPDQASPP